MIKASYDRPAPPPVEPEVSISNDVQRSPSIPAGDLPTGALTPPVGRRRAAFSSGAEPSELASQRSCCWQCCHIDSTTRVSRACRPCSACSSWRHSYRRVSLFGLLALEVDGAPPMRMTAIHILILAAAGAVLSVPIAYTLKLPVLAVVMVCAQVIVAIPLAIRRGSLIASRRFDAMGGNLFLEAGARVALGAAAGLAFGLVGLSAGVAVATVVALFFVPRRTSSVVRERPSDDILAPYLAGNCLPWTLRPTRYSRRPQCHDSLGRDSIRPRRRPIQRRLPAARSGQHVGFSIRPNSRAETDGGRRGRGNARTRAWRNRRTACSPWHGGFSAWSGRGFSPVACCTRMCDVHRRRHGDHCQRRDRPGGGPAMAATCIRDACGSRVPTGASRRIDDGHRRGQCPGCDAPHHGLGMPSATS